MRSRKLTIMVATALSVAASAVLTAPASAGVLAASATSCDAQPLSQPFRPWGDPAYYTLNAGGNFEGSLTGGTLAGGAKAVTGNEPWKVGRATDARSLLLPAGSSVLTRPICVGLGHPTMRFFARKQSGPLSTLSVSVRFETSLGTVAEVPVGIVAAGSSWTPTLPQLVVANLLPVLPNDRTAIQFRLTPLLGSWQVDDVYVDPWRRA